MHPQMDAIPHAELRKKNFQKGIADSHFCESSPLRHHGLGVTVMTHDLEILEAYWFECGFLDSSNKVVDQTDAEDCQTNNED